SNVSYPGVSPALSQRQTQDDVRHTKQQDLPVLLEGLKCRDPQVRIKTAQMMDSSARAQKPPCRP
ncbi:MAG: hypothetical protein O3A00_12050, partial [Planctomycetota bacterium]|nr:hypothetical protein [Planctomycetota bacterium]